MLFKLNGSNPLRQIITFLMVFLSIFNNVFFFNISIFLVSIYLLMIFCFGIRLSSAKELAYPSLVQCFSFFTVFFMASVLWLFCFDFFEFNALYFFNQNIQILFLVVASLVCVVSRDFLISQRILKMEYDFLFLFVVFSGLCLCFADDFLIFYIAIEIQSLAFYVFASFQRNSEFSTEAGLKYFVFGALFSCFLLLGFSFVYLIFGSSSFETLFSLAISKNDDFLFFGLLLILAVLLFKVGAAPFHIWLCDVYDGSILSVTLLFAALPKIILFVMMLKILFFSCFFLSETWSTIMLIICLTSIFIGSISALYQKRIKRLFAFSTIAHTGFILLAILAISIDSSKALIFYIVTYAFLTVLLFSLLIFAVTSTTNYPKYLANWSAIGANNPIFAYTFGLILFSIAGIPPLAGFFSKFFVLLAIISKSYFLTATMIVLISSLACFYYLRVLKMIFFKNSTKTNFWVSSSSRKTSEMVVCSLIILNVFFFVFPDFLSNFCLVLGILLF